MDTHVAVRLLALNREFYQTFSADFAQTRERLQPGVVRIARDVTREARLLALGCGGGQLAPARGPGGPPPSCARRPAGPLQLAVQPQRTAAPPDRPLGGDWAGRGRGGPGGCVARL